MGERGSPTIGLVTLAAALAAAGWWVSGSLLRFRTADRTGTAKVVQVKQAMARSGELVRAGVAFVPWGAAPTFLYTRLNDLKPGLLADTTQAARRSAEQFAKDSESRVGRIRIANQGQISIDDRDEGTADVKKVRVVTTIEYELRDD